MELTLLTNQLQNGYYLRWYFSGWHYWYFLSNGQAIDVEGEEHRSDVGERLTLGDVNLTKAKLHALRGLWRSTLVQMLTDDGWKACTIVDKSYDFGPADDPAAAIEFDLNVWARVGTFSPLIEVNREPVPEPPQPTTINYGLLYNWYATQEQAGSVFLISDAMRALGWGVPSDANWTTLTDYVQAEITAGRLPDVGIGNILKSRRQVNSPLGAPWDTSEHPRWDSNATHYGRDSVNFNAQAGSYRGDDGSFDFQILGGGGYWWTLLDNIHDNHYIYISNEEGEVFTSIYGIKNEGYSLRPVRPALLSDPTGDGVACALYIGNDGKRYRTVRIGDQVWLADNLAETKWSDGNYIQGWDADGRVVISNEDWAALTTAAVCVYDNDETYM